MEIKKTLFVISFLSLMAGCTRYDAERPEVQAVVNAYSLLEEGANISAWVGLTKQDPKGRDGFEVIEGSLISLSKNDTLIESFNTYQDGLFQGQSTIQPGTNYSIKIITPDGMSLNSKTYLPLCPSISILELDTNASLPNDTFSWRKITVQIEQQDPTVKYYNLQLGLSHIKSNNFFSIENQSPTVTKIDPVFGSDGLLTADLSVPLIFTIYTRNESRLYLNFYSESYFNLIKYQSKWEVPNYGVFGNPSPVSENDFEGDGTGYFGWTHQKTIEF